MLLDELTVSVDAIRRDSGPGHAPVEITGLAYDSRQVKPGFLFAAVPGFKFDGHAYIPKARAAGASALLTERWIDDAGLPQIQVESVRRAMAQLAAEFYSHPSNRLSLVGVTGTNGKTTTTFMVDSILRQAGMSTGLIGGIEYRIGDRTAPAKRTTPEAFDLQRLLAEMADADVTAATMEVSSHGIDLHRVDCLDFDVAVFTNLTRDHLDLHESMDLYYETKRRLFTGLDCGAGGARPARGPTAAINIDDVNGQRLAGEVGEGVIRFGLNPEADIRAGNIEYAGWETRFDLFTPDGSAPVGLHLPGAYNLENALGAAAAATALGLSPDDIARGLSESRGVPGRFSRVDINAPFEVIIDYAHNEDGLAKALTGARALTQGRLIIVFGSPGERDREKRPGMGRTAGALADLAVLTTDDCYDEPPEQILDDTEAGLAETDIEYQRIPDRRQAIESAMAMARPGDTILIAGKGHETSQIMSAGPVPFCDQTVVEESFAALSEDL